MSSNLEPSIPSSRMSSPIVDDRPASEDLLNFSSYAKGLEDLLVDSSSKTPLTIGIFGAWGTGKTTLMTLLQARLTSQGLATVWFNAWQYSKEEHLWAAFLQSLLNRIYSRLTGTAYASFAVRLLLRRLDLNRLKSDAPIYACRLILVSIPLALYALYGASSPQPLALMATLTLTGLLGVITVLRPAVIAVRKAVRLDLSAYRKQSTFEEHIGFLDKFRDHFADVVACLPDRNGKRLVVFIDDLDRCSPQNAIEVLDAIALFIDIPGCAYVLGLDAEVIGGAIATKYPNDPLAQQQYLGKIVQVPFYLPPATRATMRLLLDAVAGNLPDRRCADVLIEGSAANPREVKRTLNTFSLLWHMACRQPALREVIQPVRLAKLVVVQQSHRAFHRMVRAEPRYLRELEAYFGRELTQKQESSGVPALPSDGVSANYLPRELEPFSENVELRRLLVADWGMQGGDKFASLNTQELGLYFSLSAAAHRGNGDHAAIEVDDGVGPIRFGERYEVVALLGTGGLGRVYLAEDRVLGFQVAIKVPTLIDESPTTHSRFRREISILRQLSHPNIVKFYDSGTATYGHVHVPFLTMQVVSETLRQELDRKTHLSPYGVVRMATPILGALDYIHSSGIVHRDIKPSAIGFREGIPMLLDFGISAYEGATSITGTGALVGTLMYFAPEQILDAGVTHKTDMFGLGIVLYECLAGRRPFEAENHGGLLHKVVHEDAVPLIEVAPEVPPWLCSIVDALLGKDPEKRPNASDAMKVLQAGLRDAGSSESP